ncbi:uncharacterized protein LOC121272390 [Carcharodon carcharias]|uniref:uncharacterized protein LOC121272390 n=1 Tax=Carcharodon carcharias TaxID=13397 RepID=UPI001B7DD6AF|nr:uncharacterized protein LOC121272390 [Carcharodon carcharias]
MTPTPLTPLRAWTHCISLLCAVHGLMQNVSQVPSSLRVTEGEVISLTCTLQAATKDIKELSFIWNFGNTEETCPLVAKDSDSSRCDIPDPRVSITAHLPTKSSVLTITQATRNHSGTYGCQVKIFKPLPIMSFNGNGSVVRVEASRKMESNVSQSPSSLLLTEGNVITLNCTLWTADILPEELNFTWTSQSTQVSCHVEANVSVSSQCDSPDPRVTVTAHLPSGSSVLRINQSTLKNNGTYRCQVAILKPLPVRILYGNGSVVMVRGMVNPSSLDWLMPLAAVSALLLVFLCAFLIYILVRKNNKGQARDKAPGQVIRNRWYPVSDDQDSSGVVYSMVQDPTSGLHQQQSEEAAYAEISLPELDRPPREWVKTEYAMVHR